MRLCEPKILAGYWVRFEFNDREMNTPKTLANSSPAVASTLGQIQPCFRTLKEFQDRAQLAVANAFSVSHFGMHWFPGLVPNPGLELANAFGVTKLANAFGVNPNWPTTQPPAGGAYARATTYAALWRRLFLALTDDL